MMLNRLCKVLTILFISTNCYAGEQLADLTENSLPILNETLRQLQDSADHAPRIYTGTAAPTTIPQRKGDMFIDTTNHKIYVSDGTSASTNWRILN